MKFAHELSAAVTAIDPTLTAAFVPADDESVDPEIQLHKDGKETGVTIQLGAGYVGINSWVEAEQASHSLFFGETPDEAGAVLLKMVQDGKLP